MKIEQERKLFQLKDIVSSTYNRTWSHFPRELQPEPDVILSRFSIGSLNEKELQLHPDIPEPYLSQLTQTKERVNAGFSPSQIAKHDPRTRAIAVQPHAFTLENQRLKRIVYHEVGEDVFSHEQQIPFDQLSSADKQRATELVEYIFQGKMKPGETYVSKYGFRKILMQGGYAISDLHPDTKVLDFNEVFPTAFEIITEQIQLRHGDIQRFEKDLQTGKITMTNAEDHPNFFNVLFSILRRTGWREFLMAFKSGETTEVGQSLSVYFSQQSTQMLDLIFQAMAKDEGQIRAFNTKLIKTGFFR